MRDQELVSALRYLCPGNFTCARCEYEPVCHGGGCAIIQKAADRIANQSTHIAALQREIEKLRAQLPRWIPVEERLPETESWGASKVVLGIVQNESGYPPPNPCFCAYLGNQQWTIRGRMATITHWMPLPEPPKEER